MKRILAFLLAGIMMFSAAACGTKDNGDKHTADNTDNEIVNNESDGEESNGEAKNEEPEKFELTYPESMTAQGYETLVLDKAPERIACTATAPVPTLYAMDASIIAMPTSAATKFMFDENPGITPLKSLMSDEFNIEDVVALNPDLVILSTSYKDSHGATLEGLGINVYYQASGHGVSYDTVKEESLCLIEAFSVDEESKTKGEDLKKSFEDIEATCASLSAQNEGKKIMVLQIGGVESVYGQTSGGTLGSMMDMLGFENVADTTAAASMFQIDYETALVDQPDMLVVVGAGDSATTETLMSEIIASNPDYWNAMTAITNNQVLYLGIEYIAVYGIGYIEALESLADDVAAFSAGE